MDITDEQRAKDYRSICDLSFSIDVNVNNMEMEDSSDSETDGLKIDVSEIDGYGSTKRGSKRKAIEDVSVLNEMEEEIERQFDAKAAKTNLTATNVKNILRHVITNEKVMAMVQRTLNNTDDNDDEIFDGMKLTRSKAKELGATVLPVNPTKPASAEVQVLIHNDLPEDSSDEEYSPDQDQDQPSDDEGEADNFIDSDVDLHPSTPATPADNSTLSEEQNLTDVQYDSEGVFKIPGIPHVPTEGESIGQRTRSKLCLSETPLEYIEQSFVPPDITSDMYDFGNGIEVEYADFIRELALPLPQEVNVEDDPEADPEFNVLEDHEADIPDKEEMRSDRAATVSQKELRDLIHELHEFADRFEEQTQTQTENQESPKKRRCNETPNTTVAIDTNTNVMIESEPVPPEPDLPTLVTVEQRHLLRIQMRQHVQLMTQQFLMSYNHPEYHKYSKSCKANLQSVSYLSNGPHSAFNVDNISHALKLVADWEEMHEDEQFSNEYCDFVSQEIRLAQATKKGRRIYAQKFHPYLEKLIIESKALAYPHLLPHMFCRGTSEKTKHIAHFVSELNLIALGLEQFYPHVKENMNKKWAKNQTAILNDVVQLIRTYLVPCREQSGLVYHIKQCNAAPLTNPIKYFHETGKAPRTIHYITLDLNLLSPKEQPIELLPERWQTCVRNLKKKGNSVRKGNEKTIGDKLAQYNIEICPGDHIRNPVVSMMTNVCVQNQKSTKTKETPETPPIIKVELEQEPEEILPDIPDSYYTLENETLETENQASKLPQLRKTTPRLAKTRSAQNIKSMTQVVSGKDVLASALKTKGKTDSSKSSEASSSSLVKGDNEDEIAELMLASTTIKKNAASRKKAKQTRELENVKRLLESENELNVDERATKFAASYLQKLHATLESTDPETFRAVIKMYLDYSEKLENIIQMENENELKTDEGQSGSLNEKRLKANEIKITKDNLAIDLFREVTAKLQNYPDLCSDFLLFLNSHQAAMIDKSVEWMMLQKMQEFVHVAQVYFAKQPSRLAKVMQMIAQLAAAPHTLKNVHEVMGPVLKGYPIVMDMFLQVFPDGKPPESLFAPQLFESVTCPVGPHDKTKVYAIDAAELYEHIELPVSTTQEDPYGGDNCKCNCHDVADPKLKTTTEHCASCGTRFLNGRIYLQTSEGLRPAKITFPGENDESLENIARVSLKPAEKLIPTPSLPKRRRKSSKNDPNSDEIAAKQPTFKISPAKEALDEGAADKIGTKSKRGPRSPPKTVQPSTSGVKKPPLPVSKSKREKRAEKRDAKQEQKSQSDSNFVIKNPQYEEFPNHSFVKEEILTDDEDKDMSLEKNDVSSDSETSTNCEVEDFENVKTWSREEDAILLQSIKKDYSEQAFVTISERLGNRTVQQVKDRCFLLLNLFQKLA